jgi:AsmA family protein
VDQRLDTATPTGRSKWRIPKFVAGFIGIVLLIAGLGLAMIPASIIKPVIQREMAKKFGASVQIGAVTRGQFFSYQPDIIVHDLTITQPGWAGKGNLLHAKSISAKIGVFSVFGGYVRPRAIRIDGLNVALVRNASGRSNWNPQGKSNEQQSSSGLPKLNELSISNTTFSLRDDKRGLSISGSVNVPLGKPISIRATGSFLGTPADLTLSADAIARHKSGVPYPFTLLLNSPALHMSATGTMDSILDAAQFDATMTASAPTLKNLDRIIEAGLFGTQPIALRATIRRDTPDWHIRSLSGSIGRSMISGKADVLKRDGRTKVTGAIHASQFDFDDLADDAGRLKAEALTARIGPRIIPNTRINLSKIGKIDIAMSFVADRLISRKDSVFRSLRATASLDHHVLSVTRLVARLDNGQLTGNLRVDHRSGAPKLTTDLRFSGATLNAIIGKPDIVSGQVRGRITLTGQGDTVREALSRANGKVAMVADHGMMKATVANVLGQDLGKTIGQIIGGGKEQVPLRCMIASFRARNGVLTPSPVTIDTGASVGRANGRIVLNGESVALTLVGVTKDGSGLRIVDPIRIAGTMSAPQISVAGFNSHTKPTAGSALKILGRSIGSALGINKKVPPPPRMAPAPVNCAALTAEALR